VSPSQYRVLERLVEAGWIGMNCGPANGDGQIHYGTAEALARRGLAEVDLDSRGRMFAFATAAGVTLSTTTTPAGQPT